MSTIKTNSKILQQKTPLDRKCTLLNDKENRCNISEFSSPSYTSTIRKSLMKERRLTTFAKWKPQEEDENLVTVDSFALSPKVMLTKKEVDVMTPWRNTKMSMRDRLELWLAAKNCSKTPTPAPKQKFKNSPYPNRKYKSVSNLKKLSEENSKEVIVASPVCISAKENGTVIAKDLEAIVEKFDKLIPREEIENDLDDMISKYTTIVKFADYWIVKARLASLDNDVKRVICLLEQAHTFQAQPGEKIKEEICRYLELLEAEDKKGKGNKDSDEDKERLATLYAITPGRKVHFAAVHSPVDFKSSMIRFCLLESKAFKRRLNEQLKRKVLTPVRRSIRVERSELPEFLRTDKRVVGSPGEVEDVIVDGEVSFVPNKSINTPLNRGWLIQDETGAKINSEEDKKKGKNSVRKVNFKDENSEPCADGSGERSVQDDVEKTLNTTFDIETEITTTDEDELVNIKIEDDLMNKSDCIPEALELSFM